MKRIALAIAVAGLLVTPALAQNGTGYYTGYDSNAYGSPPYAGFDPCVTWPGLITGRSLYGGPWYESYGVGAATNGGPWAGASNGGDLDEDTLNQIGKWGVTTAIRGDGDWQIKCSGQYNGSWTGKGLVAGWPDGRAYQDEPMKAPAGGVADGAGCEPVDRPLSFNSFLVQTPVSDPNLFHTHAMGNRDNMNNYNPMVIASGKALKHVAGGNHSGWPFKGPVENAAMVAAGWSAVNDANLYITSYGGHFPDETDSDPWGNQGYSNVIFTASTPLLIPWDSLIRVETQLSVSNADGQGLNYSDAGADWSASPTVDSSTWKAYTLSTAVGDAGTLIGTVTGGPKNYDRQSAAGDSLLTQTDITQWHKRDQAMDYDADATAEACVDGLILDSFQQWNLNRPTGSADFNLDYSVGLGDLGILAGNYNSQNAFRQTGDADLDGDCDLGDLGILAGQYGTAYSAVPEPMTMILLGLGGLVAIRRRK